MNRNTFYTVLLSFFATFSACKDQPTYNKVLSVEVSNNIRRDSLFFGICFGMKSDDFFRHCFQLNQQGLFRQSQEGVQVQCVLREGFENEVIFSFFPIFVNARIQTVKGAYQYRAWAPFQPEYAASKLLSELVEVLETQYDGRSFVQMDPVQSQLLSSYVKIDANRKITLQESMDGRFVEVLFEDLRP